MTLPLDSSEQDHFCFSIPVFFSKNNQIGGQGLKTSNCIIENLSFIKICYTMKEVMGGILYHTTQVI